MSQMRGSSKVGRVGVRELRRNLSVYLDRVKAGEVLEVTEDGHVVALFTPLPGAATALEQLVAVRRATPAAGDVLALGPPLGRRRRRSASKALDELRRNER
jgi:antitoxin (DNA-binding transcriptional repressor) of toxin-antitoxin stability system